MGEQGPKGDRLAAYDVAKGKRLAQVCVAVVYLVVSAGIVFGFAALKPVLIDEGAFRHLCKPDEVRRGVRLCYGQEIRYDTHNLISIMTGLFTWSSSGTTAFANARRYLRLNLMFTLAAVATNVAALPIGAILDATGPRLTSLVGCALLAAGSLLFAFGSGNAYLVAYLLLAIGGPFVYIPVFHLSNTFPRRSGLILALATGAFDCSSALFLVFRLLHGRLGGLFSLQNLFLFYLVVPAAIAASQIFLMPSRSYMTMRELIQLADDILVGEPYPYPNHESRHEQGEEHEDNEQDRVLRRQIIISKIRRLMDYDHSRLDEIETRYSSNIEREDLHDLPFLDPQGTSKSTESNHIWGMLHMASVMQQIRSPMFILMTMFTVIQMIRLNFFISTIRLQYEYFLHSFKLATTLNHVFDIIFPIGGAVAAVPVGIFLDNATIAAILSVLLISTAAVGILGVIPDSLVAGYVHITLFVIFRPFFYTVISDYAAKVFGFQTFGRVYGLLVGLSGVGNLLQTPLDGLTLRVFHKNPIPVNLVLLLGNLLPGCALVLYVWCKSRNGKEPPRDEAQVVAEDRLEEPVDEIEHPNSVETDRLLPSHSTHTRDSAYGATQQQS